MDEPLISAVDTENTLTELAESMASQIIEEGTIFEYLYNTWQERHQGDTAIGKILILSIANGSISNSKGYHIQVNGVGGGGKTDAEQQGQKTIDPQYVLDSALTPQVLYYPTPDFIDGSIVITLTPRI